jgi:hypothetical protein
MDDEKDLVEEVELKDLEQRIEFGCCGGDGGGGPGGGGGGGGDGNPMEPK